MKVETAIKEFITEAEIRKYTPKTIKGYRRNLGLFLRFCEGIGICDVGDITLAVTRQFTQYFVNKGRKGTYINGLLKVVKSFVQYCYDEGYGGFNTRLSFRWCKEEKPVIRAFSGEQVKYIMRQANGHDFLSVRDYAILTTMFDTGLRCWELCCIKPSDVHDDHLVITAGKNHKQRVAPLTPPLKKALLKYRVAKDNYFALKNIDDYLFLSFHGRQLTNSAVEHIIKRRAEGMETDGVRVSPHTCRHTFAQQQIKMGTDLYTISRLLGHENIQITQTYLDSLRDEEVIAIAKNNSVLMNI